jgi:hypothetical protein
MEFTSPDVNEGGSTVKVKFPSAASLSVWPNLTTLTVAFD